MASSLASATSTTSFASFDDRSVDTIVPLADLFRLLGDPTRLRIVLACLDERRADSFRRGGSDGFSDEHFLLRRDRSGNWLWFGRRGGRLADSFRLWRHEDNSGRLADSFPRTGRLRLRNDSFGCGVCFAGALDAENLPDAGRLCRDLRLDKRRRRDFRRR